MNPQALVLAIQVLTREITGLNTAIVALNASTTQQSRAPTAGPAGTKSSPSTLGSMWDMVIGKFRAILGPLSLFAQVLESPIAGFQLLARSARLLATVFAPVFLPATVLLSAALVSLADIITTLLEPGFESFFSVVLALGVPALILFIDLLTTASVTLDQWARQLGVGLKGDTPGEKALSGVEKFFNALAPMVGTLGREAAEGLVASGALDDLKPKTGAGSGADIVRNALRNVMDSLRLQIAPRATISDLSGIGKSVQLAALNQDPIEAKQLRIQERIYTLLEQELGKILGGPVTGTAK